MTAAADDVAVDATAVGRAAATHFRRPGPRLGLARPPLVGSVAAGALRFATGMARPVHVRRSLHGMAATGASSLPVDVRPPRWWRPVETPVVTPPVTSLPARGVRRVADPRALREKPAPGRMADQLVGAPVRVPRSPEVAAAGPMLAASERTSGPGRRPRPAPVASPARAASSSGGASSALAGAPPGQPVAGGASRPAPPAGTSGPTTPDVAPGAVTSGAAAPTAAATSTSGAAAPTAAATSTSGPAVPVSRMVATQAVRRRLDARRAGPADVTAQGRALLRRSSEPVTAPRAAAPAPGPAAGAATVVAPGRSVTVRPAGQPDAVAPAASEAAADGPALAPSTREMWAGRPWARGSVRRAPAGPSRSAAAPAPGAPASAHAGSAALGALREDGGGAAPFATVTSAMTPVVAAPITAAGAPLRRAARPEFGNPPAGSQAAEPPAAAVAPAGSALRRALPRPVAAPSLLAPVARRRTAAESQPVPPAAAHVTGPARRRQLPATDVAAGATRAAPGAPAPAAAGAAAPPGNAAPVAQDSAVAAAQRRNATGGSSADGVARRSAVQPAGGAAVTAGATVGAVTRSLAPGEAAAQPSTPAPEPTGSTSATRPVGTDARASASPAAVAARVSDGTAFDAAQSTVRRSTRGLMLAHRGLTATAGAVPGGPAAGGMAGVVRRTIGSHRLVRTSGPLAPVAPAESTRRPVVEVASVPAPGVLAAAVSGVRLGVQQSPKGSPRPSAVGAPGAGGLLVRRATVSASFGPGTTSAAGSVLARDSYSAAAFPAASTIGAPVVRRAHGGGGTGAGTGTADASGASGTNAVPSATALAGGGSPLGRTDVAAGSPAAPSRVPGSLAVSGSLAPPVIRRMAVAPPRGAPGARPAVGEPPLPAVARRPARQQAPGPASYATSSGAAGSGPPTSSTGGDIVRRSLGDSAAARLLGPGHATPGNGTRGAGEPSTVIRRFVPERDDAPASPSADAFRPADVSGPDLDELVDKVVEAIEQRVIAELERRGRRNLPEVF